MARLVIAISFGYVYSTTLKGELHYSQHTKEQICRIDDQTSAVVPIREEVSGFAPYYYSIVTFTTLGFGDVVPVTDRARWCVAAEVIAGYLMLGALISILANKFARRA